MRSSLGDEHPLVDGFAGLEKAGLNSGAADAATIFGAPMLQSHTAPS
jgi:hypothetical protein